MVDLHCHIIWGVDDGPKTLNQSLAMIEVAVASGTTDIVATPHSNREFDLSPEIVQQRTEELMARSGGSIRIHRGCDFHLTYQNVQRVLLTRDQYTINGGRFLMVELPDLANPVSITPILRHLTEAAITPIITHPERHDLVRRNHQSIRDWIVSGCLLQITAASLTGRFGARAKTSAWNLIEDGLVHFIASDAHDAEDRTPRLDQAFDAVSKRCGSERAHDLLVANPSFVIKNEPLPYSKISTQLPSRKWFQWWGPSSL